VVWVGFVAATIILKQFETRKKKRAYYLFFDLTIYLLSLSLIISFF